MTKRVAMGRRAVITCAEQDAFTGWRKVLCYIQRPGVVAKIKRGANRRERQQVRRELRNEDA